MKTKRLITTVIIIFIGLTILSSSCNKDKTNKTGFVTFGANYNIINCITTVTIYVDDILVMR